jgi:signal peptidase II
MVLTLVATVVALDQVSKWWIARNMELHQSLSVIEGFFNITYVRNAGAAFGLLAGLPAAVRAPLFVGVSLLALTVLVVFFRGLRPEERGLRLALAAVLGGALGNLIDRIRYGEVIDFLDVHWRGYHWPAFNLADSCITVGIAVLILRSLMSGRSHATG